MGRTGGGELAGYLTVIRRRNGGNPLRFSPHYSARGEKKRLFPHRATWKPEGAKLP
ncbi:hypothetical protein K0M31_004485 [Melipona bicolor]|uniref:Uncharacterized protein n=1 Tax=Melipona bicolor TaxID=60889 RepID=A0AA40FX64_9HYME|nr:hypothetical protein K0M31_004485 [Melipona bicolor]